VPVLLPVSGFDLDGVLLRCLVFTDLTAQRAAESQAAKAREAMREQNAFLGQAREALGLGWWASAPDEDHMITWSPQAHRIYGLIPAGSAVKTETLWGNRPSGRPGGGRGSGRERADGRDYQGPAIR
jgi:hypothetical protein